MVNLKHILNPFIAMRIIEILKDRIINFETREDKYVALASSDVVCYAIRAEREESLFFFFWCRLSS